MIQHLNGRLCLYDKVTDDHAQRNHNPAVRQRAQLSSYIVTNRHETYIGTAQKQYQSDERVDKAHADTENIFLL